MLCRKAAILSLVFLSCSAHEEDTSPEEPKAPIGSARLERVDAQGIATNGPFSPSEMRSSTSENCTGFDTPVSGESCKAAHLVMATKEGGSLVIKRPIPSLRSDRSASLSAGTFVAGQLLIDFAAGDMPSGGDFPWSASYPETKSGAVTVSVAADGRATFRFDDLAMANFERTGGFKLRGELVLDCTPVDDKTVRCPERSGPARP